MARLPSLAGARPPRLAYPAEGWQDIVVVRRAQGGAQHISTEERYRLGSLGDLVELLVDGWQIEHLHYADHCGMDGRGTGPPRPSSSSTRPDQGRYGLSSRTMAGRSRTGRSVALFRERPRSGSTARGPHPRHGRRRPMAVPGEPDGWGEVPEPFPGALAFGPARCGA